MSKLNVYIWERWDRLTEQIKWGAELCWPTDKEGEWYEAFWLYTPLFDSEQEAKEQADKLAKIIESGLEL